jgi:hypothetical protein
MSLRGNSFAFDVPVLVHILTESMAVMNKRASRL